MISALEVSLAKVVRVEGCMSSILLVPIATVLDCKGVLESLLALAEVALTISRSSLVPLSVVKLYKFATRRLGSPIMSSLSFVTHDGGPTIALRELGHIGGRYIPKTMLVNARSTLMRRGSFVMPVTLVRNHTGQEIGLRVQFPWVVDLPVYGISIPLSRRKEKILSRERRYNIVLGIIIVQG